MLIYDNEYETTENKDWSKDTIELHHVHTLQASFLYRSDPQQKNATSIITWLLPLKESDLRNCFFKAWESSLPFLVLCFLSITLKYKSASETPKIRVTYSGFENPKIFY